MNRLTLFAAAAAVTAAIASSASAQPFGAPRGYCDLSASVECQGYQRGRAFDRNAFRPGEVAADRLGGDGYRERDRSYARRNGFVCQPGTWFMGSDGRPHLCQ